jgi:pyruvate dehydrogenase E2 component (dihydrolipoamide acetyltransferase)
MGESIEIKIPDIGGATDVDVIEILVRQGDVVAVDDPLVTLEGDKASMEIPSPQAGKIAAIQVKVGDKVAEGTVLCTLVSASEPAQPASDAEVSTPEPTEQTPSAEADSDADAASSNVVDIVIPDLGGASDIDVIEIAVKVGAQVEENEALLTLEGDKASMDIPAPYAGTVVSLTVKVGDKLSTGSVIGTMSTASTQAATSAKKFNLAKQPGPAEASSVSVDEVITKSELSSGSAVQYASPAVRRLARELEVDLSAVKGTGDKGRITKADLKQHLQQGRGSSAAGLSLSAAPTIDFSQFGPISTKPLSKIQKLSGANLHRNWVSIPHVTQFEDADVTVMEMFRKEQKSKAAEQGVKLTPIVFIMKAVVAALKQFPNFNASLDPSGEQLILKNYFNVGVAVDTPNGLVVPVIRDVDQKGLFELAKELGEISLKAREKGLSLKEMQGGCFTISSLGGIGGTAFTPIINAPEVAILGVSRLQKKPVYNSDGELEPRLMLPLSLSYDHRVIDGADGARFVVYLASRLADIRTLLL